MLVGTVLAVAQDVLVVSGTLKHEDTNAKLDGVTVAVLQNGEAFDQVIADRNGHYFVELPLNENYMLEYVMDGMVTKRVQINAGSAENPLDSDGYTFDLDMSLFDMKEGFDKSILETPIGIATVDDRGKLQFDMAHTAVMRRAIDRELDRLADLEEDLERAKMRYDNAMEDGARAEARQRWDDAKVEFEKALNFIPGDAEATAGLARAQAELDVLAAAEAEARAAEEAASRAQEDAERAAREAAEAAAREEEVRREAQDAESRRQEAAARAEERAAEEAQQEARAREEAQRQAEEAAQREADNAGGGAAVQASEQGRNTDEDNLSRQRTERQESEQQARDAEDAARQAQLDADQAALNAKERELQALLKAQEEERERRKAAAQSRASAASNRSSRVEDEAELYYRQALESERQAAAAEVEDQKRDVQQATRRMDAEASIRSTRARNNVLALDNGSSVATQPGHEVRDQMLDDFESQERAFKSRSEELAEELRREVDALHALSGTSGTTGREVASEYPGRAEEHRRQLLETQQSLERDKEGWALHHETNQSLLRNRSEVVALELKMLEAASREPHADGVLDPEDRDIPQGVQETSYDIQNGIVIQRTVRIGDVVTRYRKVVTKTGTYYFEGDQSITKAWWELRTNLSYD